MKRDRSAAACRQAEAEGAVRTGVHDFRAEGRRRGRSGGVVARRACRKGRGSIRKIRPPTFPRVCSPPKSRARNFICACMTSCPTPPTVETEKWEERKDGSVKIDQTIYVQREGQKADRARQRAAQRSRRSAKRRARKWRRCSAGACICSCSSRCSAEENGPRQPRGIIAKSVALEFPKDGIQRVDPGWDGAHDHGMV